MYSVSGASSTYSFYFQENIMLKEQLEVQMRENTILKRGVAIQHERQKEYDDRNIELQMLKQVVPQYQEQLRTLEVNIKTPTIRRNSNTKIFKFC